jgi:asparagine synthase (glutamine-hydrolysing)
MCGIAGIIDLSGTRVPAPDVLRRMADAIYHRGPDEDGYLERTGLGLASRRLSIVGLADGRQPIWNEDRSVAVVFNGELFDYPERKAQLEGRGHRFSTHCDTELIPHLYEDHGDQVFEQMRGQFAACIYDSKRQVLLLGRDRFGICPLYWARIKDAGGEWLLFASEAKAILASGMIRAEADPRGLQHIFTFFAAPGPFTCFKGIEYLRPGRYLKVQLGEGRISEQRFWQLDYPDWGKEDRRPAPVLAREFEEKLLAAVTRRLRADVPVVSYLSGGVDSSTVVAMASKVRGSPIPCFTIRIKAPKLDETSEAAVVARHINATPTVVDCGADEVLNTYPELIEAADSPVIDTSCAGLLLLARKVHQDGYKVALTGEGADEWLAGYPWHKYARWLSYLDVIPGLSLSGALRWLFSKISGEPAYSRDAMQRSLDVVGGQYNGWLYLYGVVTLSQRHFFSPWMKEELKDRVPLEDLDLNTERIRKWHPLNRELAISLRCHLPGLLLNGKGDRVAMNSSVETRYPFLDEELGDFLLQVDPRVKLRGLLGDKYLLRLAAQNWLPKSIAWRKKAMFRAPFDSFHLDTAPKFVEQLLSAESLRKTGYFDAESVLHWRKAFRKLSTLSLRRVSIEMGLVGVFATQLWHHIFIDGSLADLPSRVTSQQPTPALLAG